MSTHLQEESLCFENFRVQTFTFTFSNVTFYLFCNYSQEESVACTSACNPLFGKLSFEFYTGKKSKHCRPLGCRKTMFNVQPLISPPSFMFFFFAFYFRLSKSLKIELAGGWWQLWLHSQFSIFLLKTMEIDSSANNYHSLPLPHSLMYHQRHPTTFIIHIKGWSWLAPRLTYLAPSSFNSCPVLDWSSQPAILCDQSLINPRAPPNNYFIFRLIMRNWIWQGGSEQKWVESFWTKPKMGKIKHRTKNIPQKVKQITNKLQSTFTATSI